MLEQRQAGGEQNRRPVNRVRLENVLADKVLGVRPDVARELVETHRGRWLAHIRPERVVPYVGHVFGVEWELDSPIQARLRTRDAEVGERLGEHVERLVAITLGADEVGMVRDIFAHLLAVFFDLEEIIALADQLSGPVMRRADISGKQFLLGIEALAIDAVEPLVIAKINVAALVRAPEHLLDEFLMHRIGRAHPVIQINVEALERLVEKRAHLVGIGFGRESLGERGAANLVAMLVRTAQERDVIAAELAALIAREDIGGQRLVSAADMRDPVAVEDRGSDMDTIGHRISTRLKPPAESSVLTVNGTD